MDGFQGQCTGQTDQTADKELSGGDLNGCISLRGVIQIQDMHGKAYGAEKNQNIAGFNVKCFCYGKKINAGHGEQGTNSMVPAQCFSQKDAENRNHKNIGSSNKAGFGSRGI